MIRIMKKGTISEYQKKADWISYLHFWIGRSSSCSCFLPPDHFPIHRGHRSYQRDRSPQHPAPPQRLPSHCPQHPAPPQRLPSHCLQDRAVTGPQRRHTHTHTPPSSSSSPQHPAPPQRLPSHCLQDRAVTGPQRRHTHTHTHTKKTRPELWLN